MKEYLLTVIVPVYNQEELVIRALESIPSRPEIETIVIDDGSTDNTWNNLIKYRESTVDKNIIYLYNDTNKGVSYTVNKGLDNAKGKYIVILGSDDYFYTDELINILPELTKYDLIFFDIETNDGTIIESTELHQPHGSVKFMRSDFIKEVRCREDKQAGEDYYFYKELLKMNPKVKYTNKIIKHYNYPRIGSLSDKVIKGEIEGVKMKLTIILPVYNEEKLIVRALDSVPKRDDLEILVINDCSTDNTLEVVNEWIKKNPYVNVRVISHEVNKGLGEAKNTGYENARGEYINQLDSDDYLYTEEYSKVVDMLDGTDMIYINLKINDGSILDVTEESQRWLCGGPIRFIRKEFLGNSRCPAIRAKEDWYLNEELQQKPHTDKFTRIVAYHYNFPREGSLYDRLIKGEFGEL